MNTQKLILYIGSVILLIIGIYSLYIGQTSQGIIWFILGVIFLSVSPQMGRPIKAVRVRKIIILICALFLLVIGGYMLLVSQFMEGIAWIIAGILGIYISRVLKGYPDTHVVTKPDE